MHTGISLQPNGDGTYDIWIELGRYDTEFALDFFHGKGPGELLDYVKKHRLAIRAVKLVLAGSLLLSIPFTQFSGATEDVRYAMSYVYFGTPAQQINNVLQSGDTLSVISPSYFDINSDGSLKLNNVSAEFVTAMHNNGIRVVPFLSNHWDRAGGVNALNNIEQLVEDIAAAVEQYGLDGVNVDIENVTHTHRDQYTQLIRRLRQRLPADKEVSVAVAANPKGWNTGWHGSYDYAALGEVADHLFIMAYDEHYQGGEAGPVASIDFVEQSIQYALQFVPAEKVVLGIPFFGRVWNTSGSVNGDGISINRALELIERYGGRISYDRDARSPKAEFTIRAGDPSFTLNGRTLPVGDYVLWYEDSDSIKEKLSLVGKYGLKGAGNWSAGQETRDVWDYYELWLNGKYFSDIHSHFAKDEIIRITADGIMKGVSNSEFAPHASLTRAQAAVIFARLLELPQAGAQGYRDTAGHWAEAQINAATQAGLLKGYDNGTFRPEVLMSREEVAVLLARVLGVVENVRDTLDFSDVRTDRWSYNEITALAQLGILNGYEDGTFRPELDINRGEMAALVDRVRSVDK